MPAHQPSILKFKDASSRFGVEIQKCLMNFKKTVCLWKDSAVYSSVKDFPNREQPLHSSAVPDSVPTEQHCFTGHQSPPYATCPNIICNVLTVNSDVEIKLQNYKEK